MILIIINKQYFNKKFNVTRLEQASEEVKYPEKNPPQDIPLQAPS